ncbi:MAG: helix-turn-helix domain-containing protein [Dermatophilaceae bacterium]
MTDPQSGSPGPWPAVHEVSDPAVARLLVDVSRARFVGPFLGREATASDAARQLGVTLDQLLARLRLLSRAGLVTVVRTEPRAGRAVKVYRTVADEFFVPLSTLELDRDTLRSEDHWHGVFRRGFEAVMVAELGRHDRPGARICAAGPGARVEVQAAVAPGIRYDEEAPAAPPIVYSWRSIRLAAADAKELQREMYALVARFVERHDDAQPAYVVGAALASMPPDAT